MDEIEIEDPEWFSYCDGVDWYVSDGNVYMNDQLQAPSPCPKCGGPTAYRNSKYLGPYFTCMDPGCPGKQRAF